MLSKSKQRQLDRLSRPRTRAKEGLAVVEGPRNASEVLTSRIRVRWMAVGEAFSRTKVGVSLLRAAEARDVVPALHPDDELRAHGATDSPQPVVLVVEPPEPAPASEVGSGTHLLLDAVQDPGNVGTLVRTAWSFGLAGVVVGSGTADPWSPKALRASAGGAFHVPFFTLADGELSAAWGERLLYADAAGDPVTELPVDETPHWILAVGNETRGVSPGVRACGRAVSVPMAAGVDSLNAAVAGSILMYVLSRPPTSRVTRLQPTRDPSDLS